MWLYLSIYLYLYLYLSIYIYLFIYILGPLHRLPLSFLPHTTLPVL